MKRTPTEIKALLRSKGWTQVDLAARWDVSIGWISALINEPGRRPVTYEDAFAGLPDRKETQVTRQRRHNRVTKTKPVFEMFPVRRQLEALDNKYFEEGTRVFVASKEGTTLRLIETTPIGSSQELEIDIQTAAIHFGDSGLDHAD